MNNIFAKDVEIKWNIYPNIPAYIKDFDFFDLLSFNVSIYNKDNELLNTKNQILSSTREFIIDGDSLNEYFDGSRPVLYEYAAGNTRGLFHLAEVKKILPQNFIYSLEENYNDFVKTKNKKGFFKNLSFSIKYDNFDINQKIDMQYSDFKINNFNSIFLNIYKNSDDLSLKFKINKKEYFDSTLNGLYVIPYDIKTNQKLKSIYINNIYAKWLDTSEEIKILSLPFNDNSITESSFLKLKIFYFNESQGQILDFFREKMNETEFENFLTEYFTDQYYSADMVYKENLINQTIAYFQAPLYLFNQSSLSAISWPNEEINIFGCYFKNYFPKSNKDLSNFTFSLGKLINVIDSTANDYRSSENIPANLLGFFIKNDNNDLQYKDINYDLPYFKFSNIKNASIVKIEKENSITKIYLEFITLFPDYNSIYLENISQNLFFLQKYYKSINDTNYATFLFCYEYDNNTTAQYLSNNLEDENRIIQDSKLINFSLKLLPQ
jgi:hypothetical protein